MRAFLDTNIVVAAFATRGLCADVVRTVLAEHELVLSSTVIEELTRTLIEKIRLPETAVREIEAFLRATDKREFMAFVTRADLRQVAEEQSARAAMAEESA